MLANYKTLQLEISTLRLNHLLDRLNSALPFSLEKQHSSLAASNLTPIHLPDCPSVPDGLCALQISSTITIIFQVFITWLLVVTTKFPLLCLQFREFFTSLCTSKCTMLNFLDGQIFADVNHTHNENYTAETILRKNPELMAGGRWKPQRCRSRHKVAVIVPYRSTSRFFPLFWAVAKHSTLTLIICVYLFNCSSDPYAENYWHIFWFKSNLTDDATKLVGFLRDRANHLMVLMAHLHPVLQRQLIDYRVFVVEQVSHFPSIMSGSALRI